jgi:hypothetical protein
MSKTRLALLSDGIGPRGMLSVNLEIKRRHYLEMAWLLPSQILQLFAVRG